MQGTSERPYITYTYGLSSLDSVQTIPAINIKRTLVILPCTPCKFLLFFQNKSMVRRNEPTSWALQVDNLPHACISKSIAMMEMSNLIAAFEVRFDISHVDPDYGQIVYDDTFVKPKEFHEFGQLGRSRLRMRCRFAKCDSQSLELLGFSSLRVVILSRRCRFSITGREVRIPAPRDWLNQLFSSECWNIVNEFCC